MGLSEIGPNNQTPVKIKTAANNFHIGMYLYLERSICEMIFSWVWSDHSSLWCGSPAGPEAPTNGAHRQAMRQPKIFCVFLFVFFLLLYLCVYIHLLLQTALTSAYKRRSQTGPATAEDGPSFCIFVFVCLGASVYVYTFVPTTVLTDRLGDSWRWPILFVFLSKFLKLNLSFFYIS